jgi:hypothetical protein
MVYFSYKHTPFFTNKLEDRAKLPKSRVNPMLTQKTFGHDPEINVFNKDSIG